MAVEMDVSIESNTDEVKKELDSVKDIILEEWGLAGEGFAKLHITDVVYDTEPSPNYKRTGNLRNSLTHAIDDNSAYIGTNVEYAPYVELGTSKMPPRPYLRPAIEEHIDEYRQIMENRLSS